MSKNAKRRLKEFQAKQTAENEKLHQQNQAKAQELVKKAQAVGAVCLDSIVHDLKSMEASAINNGGASEQIAYIIEEMGEEVGIKSIEEAINGRTR